MCEANALNLALRADGAHEQGGADAPGGDQVPPAAIPRRIRSGGREDRQGHIRRGRGLQDRALADAHRARGREDLDLTYRNEAALTVSLMGLLAEESLIAQRLGKLGRKKNAA